MPIPHIALVVFAAIFVIGGLTVLFRGRAIRKADDASVKPRMLN